MNTDVSDYQLERFLLDELAPDERAALLARIGSDPALQVRLDALDASSTALLAAYPAATQVPEIERRLHLARVRESVARSRRVRTGALAIALPLAAAAILFAVGPRLPESPPGEPGLIETTPKGEGHGKLRLHRRTAAGSESLAAGATVAAGDALQVSFVPGTASHATVVSIDGAGAVTLHWPVTAAQSTAVSERVLVPNAYELDDAPEFERFLLVTSDRPIDVARVLAAGRELARGAGARSKPLSLADGQHQTDVLVEKGAR